MVAVRGAARSLRHGGDGRFSPDGRLHCRWPSQVTRGYQQLIQGADVLPSLGTAAVPDEVLLLAREAVVTNPYWSPWLAGVAAAKGGLDAAATTGRLAAEAALRFGADATYDGRTVAFRTADAGLQAPAQGVVRTRLDDALVADQLRRFSLLEGADPDPVGVTAWSQPWVPLWLEWEVEVHLADRLDGWALGAIDRRAGRRRRARAVHAHAARPQRADDRHRHHAGRRRALAGCRGRARPREHRRGRRGDRGGADHARRRGRAARRRRRQPRRHARAAARLRLRRGPAAHPRRRRHARPAGHHGRGAELPARRRVDRHPRAPGRRLRPHARRCPPGRPRCRCAPRCPRRRAACACGRGSRCRRGCCSASSTPPATAPTAAEARVDQVDAAQTVNPVAGFLLPDHIDESLEVFDVAGTPLGQLCHEPIGGGVVWEIAPGRAGPADAGPLYGLAPAARPRRPAGRRAGRRRRAGPRRAPARGGRRVRALGAAAGDRHDAVDRRRVPLDGQRAHRRPRRPARRRRPRAADARRRTRPRPRRRRRSARRSPTARSPSGSAS